jgi:hypothetical protein
VVAGGTVEPLRHTKAAEDRESLVAPTVRTAAGRRSEGLPLAQPIDGKYDARNQGPGYDEEMDERDRQRDQRGRDTGAERNGRALEPLGRLQHVHLDARHRRRVAQGLERQIERPSRQGYFRR